MNTLELSKSLGLTPKKKDKISPLFYNGIYSKHEFVPCKLVDLICDSPKIVRISINSEYHDIALDYLLEMQIDYRENERIKHKNNLIVREDKGNSLLFFPSSYCVLDLETTGYSPKYDQIIEIGIIKVVDGSIVDSFSSLVFSEYLPDHITGITGITKETLADAPKLEDVIPQAIDFIGDDFIVGHNISFDINFLYDAKLNILKSTLKNDFICTMRLFRYLHKNLPHHRLSDMTKFYNVNNENAHRALSDCMATFHCLNYMSSEAFEKYNSYVLPEIEYSHCRSTSSKKDAFHVIENVKDKSNNIFVDKNCVFTGTLSTMTRSVASQLITEFGGFVENNVTKKTNYLILGDYDYSVAIKDGKSNKHKKAEQALLSGQDITIITESVFLDIIQPLLKQEANNE